MKYKLFTRKLSQKQIEVLKSKHSITVTKLDLNTQLSNKQIRALLKNTTFTERFQLFKSIVKATGNPFELINNDLSSLKKVGVQEEKLEDIAVVAIYTKLLTDPELIDYKQRELKNLKQTLKLHFVQIDKKLKAEHKWEQYHTELFLNIDYITELIGFIKHALPENNSTEKEKAIIISEILNELSIYNRTPFPTLSEANTIADKKLKKATKQGKNLDNYRDGETIIYERMKHYFKKWDKLLSSFYEYLRNQN